MIAPVFVAAYGTLMTGQVNALSTRTRVRLVSVGPCRIPGVMHRIWEGGTDYPGLVPGPAGVCVAGELFQIGEAEAAEVLADLDVYEDCRPGDAAGSSYVRRVMPVEAVGGTVEAWVYVFNRPVGGFEIIPGGRWAAVIARDDSLQGVSKETRPYQRRLSKV